MKFKITNSWDGDGYRVSIPNYIGGDVVSLDEYEQAMAEKDREIDELKKRVQRAPEEWESVCGECNGSGWR